MAAEIFRHGQIYINLGNVFAECVHYLFYFFNFNLSLSLFICGVCWRLKCSLSKQEIIFKVCSFTATRYINHVSLATLV